MLAQLVMGAMMTALCVIIQAFFIATAGNYVEKAQSWLGEDPSSNKKTLVLVLVMMWLVLGVSLGCASWTYVFLYLGAFDALEPALYFSMVTFTTLGFGDLTLIENFRLLSGLTAVSGLFVFGLTSAFIVDLMGRLRSFSFSRPN